jgi:hypothetical protein
MAGAVSEANCPCCITLDGGPLSFFLPRRIRKIPNAIATMRATPPIVPPTIGPIGVGDEEEVGDVEDVDVVEELVNVELDVGEGVEDETACIIVIVTNANEADDVPPSVAVAYIVDIAGVASQYQRVAGRFASPITNSWLQKGKKVSLISISTRVSAGSRLQLDKGYRPLRCIIVPLTGIVASAA